MKQIPARRPNKGFPNISYRSKNTINKIPAITDEQIRQSWRIDKDLISSQIDENTWLAALSVDTGLKKVASPCADPLSVTAQGLRGDKLVVMMEGVDA